MDGRIVTGAAGRPTVPSGESRRYFLRLGVSEPEREVTRQEYVAAERAAGFYPKPGLGPEATGAFWHGQVEGRIEYDWSQPE